MQLIKTLIAGGALLLAVPALSDERADAPSSAATSLSARQPIVVAQAHPVFRAQPARNAPQAAPAQRAAPLPRAAPSPPSMRLQQRNTFSQPARAQPTFPIERAPRHPQNWAQPASPRPERFQRGTARPARIESDRPRVRPRPGMQASPQSWQGQPTRPARHWRPGTNRPPQAQNRRWRWNRHRHGQRYRHRRPGFIYFYDGFFYEQPWWQTDDSGYGYAEPTVDQPVYETDPADWPTMTPSQRSRHIAWCRKRYKTYDVRTDTFVAKGGVRRRCISPFVPRR